MATSKYWKEESKKLWSTTIPDEQSLVEQQLQLGCLMRIADSLEKMEKPFDQLIRNAENYKNMYYRCVQANVKKDRQIAAYKGVIKKLKKK